MKSVFLFTALLFCAALQAQKPATSLPRLKERALNFQKNGSDTLLKMFQQMVVVRGNKVVLLPQDNMPCIIPDTKDIVAVPNAGAGWKPPVAGKIPNAAKETHKLAEK